MKKLFPRSVSFLVIFCVLCLPAVVAQESSQIPDPNQLDNAPLTKESKVEITKLMAKLNEICLRYSAFGFSGTVLVAERGRVLLHKGYGFADRARHIPNSAATVFPLASITKQYTAAAIYKLETEGKLKTTDKIGVYLHGIPEEKSGITIAQLLTHSSGLSRESDNIADVGATRREFVERVLRVPLQSQPGERYSYSNTGYNLLAAIVEEVSGRTFESYLREKLFRPAGLTRTGWRSEFDSLKFALGYQEMFLEAQSEVTNPPLPSWRFLGSGSVVGTVGDLYKWDRSLYTNRVLAPDARKKLFAPAFNNYVNGWWTTKTKQGVDVSFTDGDFPGYSTRLARFHARRITIVVAANGDGGWVRLLTNGLRDILFGEKYVMPPVVVAARDVQLLKLSGKYALASGATFDVRATNDALVVGATGQEALSILIGADALSETQFVSANIATEQLVQHLKNGDFDWLKSVTEFPTPAPLERLRNFWATMLGTKGEMKDFQVIGTVPSRGGRSQTLVRFDLKRGKEFWLLLWQGGKLEGWDVNIVEPRPTRFLPVSATDFASLDILSGRITLISFRQNAGGRGFTLISSVQGKEVEVRKVQ